MCRAGVLFIMLSSGKLLSLGDVVGCLIAPFVYSTVLATFLLLDTKAACRVKAVFGFMVPEGQDTVIPQQGSETAGMATKHSLTYWLTHSRKQRVDSE